MVERAVLFSESAIYENLKAVIAVYEIDYEKDETRILFRDNFKTKVPYIRTMEETIEATMEGTDYLIIRKDFYKELEQAIARSYDQLIYFDITKL